METTNGVMNMSELKPCPFCGNKDIEWQESHVGFSIECYKCEFHVGGDLTLTAAEKLWNTRINDSQLTTITKQRDELFEMLKVVIDDIDCYGEILALNHHKVIDLLSAIKEQNDAE